MKSLWIRWGQLVAFPLAVIFVNTGINAEGLLPGFGWFLAASFSTSAFVALVKLDIKKERNA